MMIREHYSNYYLLFSLQVHKVDIMNADSMVEHFKGADAVLSCLGARVSINICLDNIDRHVNSAAL